MILAGLLVATGTVAQDINQAATLEDLGFANRLHGGARGASLVGAMAALTNDSHALLYNPAGLARMHEMELKLGFQHHDDQAVNRFFGNTSSGEMSRLGLDHLAGSYAFPTYRGSLVIGFGVFREFSSDLDIINRAFNPVTDTADDYRLQQSGGVFSYNVGAATDVAKGIALGATLFILDGTVEAFTQSSYIVTGSLGNGDVEREFIVDNARLDVDGVGARIGVQVRPGKGLRFGLTVTTPIPTTVSGDATTEFATYIFNSTDVFTTRNFSIDTEYILPARFELAAAARLVGADVTLQLGYTDWGSTQVNTFLLKDTGLRDVFREVVSFRLAAEWPLPGSRMTLRGGYAYLPHPLAFLQADRIVGDRLERATVDREQSFIAGGLGVRVTRAVELDAGFEYSVGERSIPTLVDERNRQRMLLSAKYLF